MTRAKFGSLPALLLAGIFQLAGQVQAGPIFVPGQLEAGKFTRAPGVPLQCYTIRFSTSTVTVEKNAARIEVEEIVDGPDKTIPAICLIPMPDGVNGASIRVSWGAMGSEPKLLHDAAFLDSAKAQEVYETIARGGQTKILAYTGRPAILVPSVELGGKKKITIAFSMETKSTQGVHMLTCSVARSRVRGWPGRASHGQRPPVEQATAAFHLQPHAHDDHHAQEPHRGDGHRQGRPLDRHGRFPPFLGGRQ